MSTLSIAFHDEATETFQNIVQNFTNYLVQVTPEDGGEPFDAVVLGGSGPESEWLDEIELRRTDENGDPLPDAVPEFVRVNQILVY